MISQHLLLSMAGAFACACSAKGALAESAPKANVQTCIPSGIATPDVESKVGMEAFIGELKVAEFA